MKGILFDIMAGAFITKQGVANTRISDGIGTWQAATLTQFTGFAAALLILLLIRDRSAAGLKQVKPLYLSGGALAAIIIFSNVTAIQQIGVTLSVAIVMIAQLGLTLLADLNRWFGVEKQKARLPQFIGIAMMIAGLLIMKF